MESWIFKIGEEVITLLISITGPSGAGKRYVKERIIARYPFVRELTWITTRPLRAGELLNADRKTVSVNQFRKYQKRGSFIIDQNLFGHFYGLEKRVFLKAVESSDIYWTEFHIDSLVWITELGFSVISIALVPLSTALLRRRLNNRGGSRDGEIEERIAAVQAEVDKINCHRDLFQRIIDISERAAKDEVVPQVLEALKPFLHREERYE